MYKLICDWDNGYDKCLGLEEVFDSWQDAKECVEEMKLSGEFSNFLIVDIED